MGRDGLFLSTGDSRVSSEIFLFILKSCLAADDGVPQPGPWGIYPPCRFWGQLWLLMTCSPWVTRRDVCYRQKFKMISQPDCACLLFGIRC